ncbi:hypothetical protein IL54_4675 [Sphingobium sp. ba1]|nr:hypothetical protein IL54_4675 [Sphingobium sp. ba1]
MPKRTEISIIRSIGIGQIIIGQACEIDCSRAQALMAPKG